MSNLSIFKYPLSVTDEQEVVLPCGANILTVEFQNGHLCLWAKVDKRVETRFRRTIQIFGTGNPIPDDLELVYIGTVQQFDGQLVWHVFEDVTYRED